MAITRMYTVEDLELAESKRNELIRGELRDVSPSFSESSAVSVPIGSPLFLFVDDHGLGVVFGEAGGFVLSRDPDTVVGPDVLFVSRRRVPPDHNFRSFFPGPPDLAVEVVSASDRPGEITEKIDLYREAGVPLLWVVRPAQQTATVYRPGHNPAVLGMDDTLDAEDVVPGFRLPIAYIFKPF